jgi:hypothetical protein
MKVLRLSGLCTGRLYQGHPSPQEIFLVLISVKGWVIMSMKSSNDAIGNRTRDLPDQPTAPQRTSPVPVLGWTNLNKLLTFQEGFKSMESASYLVLSDLKFRLLTFLLLRLWPQAPIFHTRMTTSICRRADNFGCLQTRLDMPLIPLWSELYPPNVRMLSVKECSNRTNLYKYIQRTEQLHSYTVFNADTVPQRYYV